ncbi:MAG TPA: hypothetical protein VMT50_04645, partial [Steroidobacteraceae bacterium]|nr:hypothetical protein [Steroidobacteraceae bacterium]
TGRPIVLSLSPGPAQLSHASEIIRHAQMWRIANDLWDGWTFAHSDPQNDFPTGLRAAFDNLAKWSAFAAPGHWPDGDMLPFGSLTPHPGWGLPRESRLSHEEERCALTLWAVARSPLILGGNLTQLDPFTRSLITNRDVLEVDQQSSSSRPVTNLPQGFETMRVWVGSEPREGKLATIVAVFNLQDASAAVHATWAELTDAPSGDAPSGHAPSGHAPSGRRHARNLWSGAVSDQQGLAEVLPAHGCAIYRLE